MVGTLLLKVMPGVPSWLRWIILWGVVSGAILYGLRLYSNSVYEQGKQQGKLAIAKDLETDTLKKLTEERAQVKKQSDDLTAEKVLVDKRLLEAEQARASSMNTLSGMLTQARTRQEVTNAQVATIPATELDNAIRAQSNKLAAGTIGK